MLCLSVVKLRLDIPCNGDVVHGNIITNIPSFLTGGGIVLDDCTQNAVVSDNTIGNLSGCQIGFVEHRVATTPLEIIF